MNTIKLFQYNTLNSLYLCCRLMGIDGNLFSTPNKELFESSEGHIGVEAFVKARQGWLFPLASGLCFLESVSCLFAFI